MFNLGKVRLSKSTGLGIGKISTLSLYILLKIQGVEGGVWWSEIKISEITQYYILFIIKNI